MTFDSVVVAHLSWLRMGGTPEGAEHVVGIGRLAGTTPSNTNRARFIDGEFGALDEIREMLRYGLKRMRQPGPSSIG